MNTIRVAHIADIHWCRRYKDEAAASLRSAIATARERSIDVWALPGDIYDQVVQNSERDAFPELLDLLSQMLEIAPIVAVRGTPSHDTPGSYDALTRLRGPHGFHVLEPGKAYCLDDRGLVCPIEDAPMPRALILGCGEPSKEWFLADKTGLGREQAAEAVVDGMRALLLGLGAIRKEHADLPALVAYHGQIVGATLASGQALRPGGVQIGRDDLALIDPAIVARYSGAVYPTDWGERHQASWCLAEITGHGTYGAVGDIHMPQEIFDGGGTVTVELVPFPHAPRVKIASDGVNLTLSDLSDFAGKQAWLVVKQTKENLDTLDADQMLEWLIEHGALPGSRVTFEEIPTETVRAGEISEAHSLGDKLRIYAENSNETIPEGVPDKAEQLETEARADGAAPAGLHIRIDRLRLRGAIGVWKGQGVDEIDLDLAGYDDGLIALLGPNGAGKTTLIENLHPFPSLLTRDGKLQDHFRLRDSYRDLTWTDLRTGDVYRSLIAIDASAACDYHLYRNGEPLVNGRKADYELRIAELFGSLSLYLRSAFVTQRASKSAPELSEATKGERKSLFRELGGLDYLQGYADRAKAHRATIETALIADQREVEILTRETYDVPDYAADLETQRASLATARQLVASIEAEGKDARKAADKAQARLTRHRAAEVELNGLRNQVSNLGRERADLEQRIAACRKAEAQRPDLERKITNYETLKAEEESLNAKRTDVLLDRERITAEHARALEAHRTEQRKIESRQRELKDEAATIAREKVREMAAVDALLARLATVTCPHCGGTFSLGGETEMGALSEKQQRVLDLDCDLVLNEHHAKGVAAELAALVTPAAPELPVYDETPLEAVRDELAGYSIKDLRAALDQARTAATQIEAAQARIVVAGRDLMGLQVKIAAAEGRLDATAVADQAAAQQRVDSLALRWREAHGKVTAAEAEVKTIETAIAELERKRARLAETRARVAAAQSDAAAWAWLQRACGPDGIQALELDAMGPGIAAVANRILEAAYGQRFQIAFVTARLSGSGARAKQVEDFQIIVRDSERGGEQPIETLSGGESVWVKRALYDAFGIVRDRATGQRFLTCFQDEADGALDPEARIAYVRMLEAAHHEAGRRHTILITHSETVQQMVAQRIDMRELARARAGAPA